LKIGLRRNQRFASTKQRLGKFLRLCLVNLGEVNYIFTFIKPIKSEIRNIREKVAHLIITMIVIKVTE
jgi:hypothetical protein